MPAANSAPLTGPVDAQTFRNIAKAVSPTVVNIRTESRQREQELTEFFGGDDLFRRFFGQPRQPNRGQGNGPTTVAAGTGFIIAKEGLILTNNHVVEGADKVEVSLYGEEDDLRYRARVVGRDPLTDSALIELTEKPDHALPEAKFGDSAQMQPGDWVMAIGNPFGLSHTVSVGVVSALKRPFPVSEGRTIDMLQTDAAINPGNSGGPLLNVRGEVVGMNTAIFADSRQSGNIGIGFAVPINVVRSLLPQLRTGKITRGMIGVSVQPVPREALEEFGLKERTGAVVAVVTPKGPADNAGMEPGDVILEVNNHPIGSRDELVQTVMALTPGTTVPVDGVARQAAQDAQRHHRRDQSGPGSRPAGRRGQPGGGHDGRLRHVARAASPPNAPVVLACLPGTNGAVVMEVEPTGHRRARRVARRRRDPAGESPRGGIGGRRQQDPAGGAVRWNRADAHLASEPGDFPDGA